MNGAPVPRPLALLDPLGALAFALLPVRKKKQSRVCPQVSLAGPSDEAQMNAFRRHVYNVGLFIAIGD